MHLISSNSPMEKHIHQLLHLHECVVIPNFGAFVLRYYPAELQEGTLMFRPPSRRVCFQPGLTVSDGILNHYIARKMSMSYRNAEALIDRQVREWRQTLRSGHSIALSGIGKIYQMPGGGLEFFPELNTNFLRESYGLPIIRLDEKKNTKIVTKKIHTPVSPDLSTTKEDALIFAPWLRRIAAVALPAALAFNMVSTSRTISDYEAGMVHMDWIAKTDVATIRHHNVTKAPPALEIDLTKEKADEPIAIDARATNEITKETKIPGAHIIVGAFSDRDNAERYITKLRAQGFTDAQTAGKAGNLTRVSAGAYNTTEDARAALENIRKKLDGGAWVYTVQ